MFLPETAHHEKFIIYNAVVQQRGSIKVTSLSRNQSLNVLLPSIHNVNPKSTDYYRYLSKIKSYSVTWRDIYLKKYRFANTFALRFDFFAELRLNAK